MVACQEGHLDIAKFLIRREADVNAKNIVSHRDEVCRNGIDMTCYVYSSKG
jgi:ankyrin repeat protein